MFDSDEVHSNNPQAVTDEELSDMLKETQSLERDIKETQDRARAQTFQRVVEAAAVSTRTAIHNPPAHRRQAPAVAHREAADIMAGSLSLDSLIVQIIAKAHAYPPIGPAKELQDLVWQLPAAVQAERAAYGARTTNLPGNASGNGHPSGYFNLDAHREIQSLKSQNESLESDVKTLEDAKNKAEADGQKKIKKLNRSLNEFRSTAFVKEINQLKSLNGGLKAKISRLEQAANVPQPRGILASTTGQAMVAPYTTTSFASGNKEQPIVKNANLTPISNLQHGFQLGNRSPAQDPRPQLYTASSAGFIFQPSLAKPATNPLSNNDEGLIHPSRLSQMDNGGGLTAYKQSVSNNFVPTFGNHEPGSMQVDKPEISGQARNLSAPGNASIQSHTPQVRTAMSSQKWQATFGALFRPTPSQGLQALAPNENHGIQAAATQDPRLAARVNIESKKRATSPDIAQEAPKKIKVEVAEDVTALHGVSEEINKPLAEELSNGVDSAKQILTPVPGHIEQGSAQPAESGISKKTTQLATADIATNGTTSDLNATQSGVGGVVEPPAHQVRRDSAVVIPVVQLKPNIAESRKPTCLSCSFAKRECDQKSPCGYCETNKFDCVFWKCAFGEACNLATCWNTHEPAEPNRQQLAIAAARSDPSA